MIKGKFTPGAYLLKARIFLHRSGLGNCVSNQNQGWKKSLPLFFMLICLWMSLSSCDVIVDAAQGRKVQEISAIDTPPPANASTHNQSAISIPSQPTWKDLPVIPEITGTAREIYARGLIRGNNPHAFSKVGDCQNVPSMFLAPFDDPLKYRLGEEYAYLQETIDWYAGSFVRESEAVRRGFNAASVVSPFWADPEACDQGESPLECEIRIHKPIIAIISLETWWDKDADSYERFLREIIEVTIEHDVVPILTTKADNLEGDHHINATIARLAVEYDILLWNFWLAVQPLPAHGLMSDGFHLTYAANYFDDPERMTKAWPWRNLTALQVIDTASKGLATP